MPRALHLMSAALLLGLALPAAAQERAMPEGAQWVGRFDRNQAASDDRHWGQGTVYVTKDRLVLRGEVSPGPAYGVYLTPVYAESGREFRRIRSASVRIGPLRNFENFQMQLPKGVRVEDYPNVLIWCERFRVFITSSRLRRVQS